MHMKRIRMKARSSMSVKVEKNASEIAFGGEPLRRKRRKRRKRM